MISVTTMRGESFILNSDLIETIYEKPDTTIHLTNGNIYLVQEPMNEVVQKIVAFRRQIFQNSPQGNC